MIFGDPCKFAIELIETEIANNLAPLRLFICNQPLGTLDDKTYLPPFIYKFKFRLENLYELEFSDCNISGNDVLNHISSLETRFEFYRLSLGDSFDDYQIYIYLHNKKAYLLWKIIDEPFFDYQKKEMDRVFLYEIDILNIKAILSRLEEYLSNIDVI